MDQERRGLQDEAGQEPEFFVSRAGPDAAIAQRIAHILEDAGRRVVIQDWDFKNRAFMERMHAALTSGARTIALLSPDYLTRDHCAAEWQNTIADDPLNRHSKLIVLRIRPCDPVGLLKSFAFWDLVPLLSTPEQDGLLRDAVLASVRTGRQKDPLSPITRFFEAAKPILHAEIKPIANFTGRETALKAIGAALERGAKTAVTQPAAVHGLGGIGKSTLAREFARAAADAGRYSGVWWLRAEKSKDSATWDGIEQGLADLRTVLYPGLEPPKERAKAARDTLNFLGSGGFEKPWLLVYDNVDDEELLEAWSPPANVQVLMTSRLGNWGAEVAPVEVEEWELDEAVRYLRDASGRGDLGDAALTHIANELGRLPLALSHAAAYLKRNRAVTADTYLSELSRRMQEAPKGAAYKASVFATFQLAMEQAEAEAPGARSVLTLAAFFAPDNIPEELFKQAPEIYPPELQPLAASKARLAEAISALDHLSLADFDPAKRTFSVHRLVQAAARDALRNQAPVRRAFSLRRLLPGARKSPSNGNTEADWIAAAVKACAAAYPGGDFQHWAAYERLLAHVRAAADIASDDIGPPLADVLNGAGFYLHDQAAYAEAGPLYERALAIWEKALGPDHPDVARALDNLARLYRAQGAYERAEPLFERALAIREEALGPGHPDMATTLSNLAGLYRAQGAYGRAEPLYERSLAIREEALGPSHPDVAQTLNNLAVLYDAQGAYEHAEPLYERALAIWEKALGPGHPDVARALDNLAGLYCAQGAYGRAEPLSERALAIFEKALGPAHPDVATTLSGLAGVYRAQGAYGRAEPLYERALAIREKALGPGHPDVAQALDNLAMLYDAQGAYGRAEPLCERALAILEKALGPAHPEVATTLSNLAGLYDAQGAYGRAEPLYERSLAIREKALGPGHPDVARALNNLAGLYRAQGAYGRAEPLYERSLAIREEALGPGHPDVAQALNNLALLYRAQGAYERAELLYERALAIREEALGPGHPDVAQTLNNLALLYRAQGAYERAEPLYERALAIREEALGPSHPDVAQTLNNLAGLYHYQGAYERAEPLFERALAIWEKALGPDHPHTKTARGNLAALQQAAEGGAQAHPKAGRNDPCPCGSGKRYKHCHGALH